MWFHNRIVAWFSVSCLFRMEQLVEILCFLKLLLSYTWIELAFLYFNLLALLLIHKSWGNGFCIVCQIEALVQIWLTLILANNRHCIEVLSLDLFLVSRRDWKTVIFWAVTFFKPFICFVKLTCILILSNLQMALDMINYLTWQMAIVLNICFQLAWRIHVVFKSSRLLRIVWQIFLTPTFVRNRVQRISPIFVLLLIVQLVRLSWIFAVLNHSSSIWLLRIHNSHGILSISLGKIFCYTTRFLNLIERLPEGVVLIRITHIDIIFAMVPDNLWCFLLA